MDQVQNKRLNTLYVTYTLSFSLSLTHTHTHIGTLSLFLSLKCTDSLTQLTFNPYFISTNLFNTVVRDPCSLGFPSPEVMATSIAYTSYCSNVQAST